MGKTTWELLFRVVRSFRQSVCESVSGGGASMLVSGSFWGAGADLAARAGVDVGNVTCRLRVLSLRILLVWFIG